MRAFRFLIFVFLLLQCHVSLFAQDCNTVLQGADYTVTNTNDTGPGSLRDAINAVNQSVEGGNIYVHISGASAGQTQTIQLFSALPAINLQVYIDGYDYISQKNIVIQAIGAIPGPAITLVHPSSCFLNIGFSGFTPVNYVVTNTNDFGAGSLRQGIQNINSSGTGGVIRFDIPGMAPHIIKPLTLFPDIQYPVHIDGTTQASNGYTGAGPNIVISGKDIPEYTAPGEFIRGISLIKVTNAKIYGLKITDFDNGISMKYCTDYIIGQSNGRNVLTHNDVGIYSYGCTGGLIAYNYAGIEADGSTMAGNNTAGIQSESDTLTWINNNVVSGNLMYGILLRDATSARITANKIGTNPAGTSALYNLEGIYLEHSKGIIGGTAAGEGNIISGNLYYGIYAASGGRLYIKGNKIGTDITGTARVPNMTGMSIDVNSVYIGGDSPAERNIVSGNGDVGIIVQAIDTVSIQNNYIGTDISGTQDLGNGTSGIMVWDDASVTHIGGPLGTQGNLISGNGYIGLYMHGRDLSTLNEVVLSGNTIGLDVSQAYRLPNEYGIGMDDKTNNYILKNNVVSGNKIFGITAKGKGHAILSNLIGTNSSGASLGNGLAGISLYTALNCIVGGSDANANVIAYNIGNGIISDGAGTFPSRYNLLTRNSMYGNRNTGISLGTAVVKGNDGYAAPVILHASASHINGTATPGATIELYRNHTNNTFAQGIQYLYSTSCDASGNWSYSGTIDPLNIVALAWDPVTNNTSEFSASTVSPNASVTSGQFIQPGLSIYPNPVMHTLTLINPSGPDITQHAIHSIEGSQISAYSFTNNGDGTSVIVLQDTVNPGIYLLTVTNSDRTSIVKFVVSK